LLPSAIQRVGEVYKGHASIQINVSAQQRVSFGLVPTGETDKYPKASALLPAMERLPCGSGGSGQVSISCEIPSGNTYVLMVADVREPLRSADGDFVTVRREKKGQTTSSSQYNNAVTISATFTAIPPPTGK
jgi:hypothetical protein